ncbi:hypothetical protein ACFVS2_08325 [Brevibacillus sp. NPDC058079]
MMRKVLVIVSTVSLFSFSLTFLTDNGYSGALENKSSASIVQYADRPGF